MDLYVIEILIRKSCCNTDQIGIKWNFSIKRFSGLKNQNCTLNVCLFEKKNLTGHIVIASFLKIWPMYLVFSIFFYFLFFFGPGLMWEISSFKIHFSMWYFDKRRFLRMNKDPSPSPISNFWRKAWTLKLRYTM